MIAREAGSQDDEMAGGAAKAGAEHNEATAGDGGVEQDNNAGSEEIVIDDGGCQIALGQSSPLTSLAFFAGLVGLLGWRRRRNQ